MPSPLSLLLQSTAVTSLSTIAAFFVYTKHCHFSDDKALNPVTDPLVKGEWYRKLNPEGNEVLFDECVRRMPVWKVKRELVEDSERGGTKLIEAFTGGVWGGFGYTPQRLYLQNKYRSSSTSHQLWDKPSLLSSPYNPGTEITDHFAVLTKTPTSILIRCGDSPLNSPGQPRPSDGLFEITATTDLEKGYVEFRLKSLFFQGVGRSSGKPLGGKMGLEEWLHRAYTKLLMESAVGRCLVLK